MLPDSEMIRNFATYIINGQHNNDRCINKYCLLMEYYHLAYAGFIIPIISYFRSLKISQKFRMENSVMCLYLYNIKQNIKIYFYLY